MEKIWMDAPSVICERKEILNENYKQNRSHASAKTVVIILNVARETPLKIPSFSIFY